MNTLFSNGWQKITAANEQSFGWQSQWILDRGSLTEKLRSVCKEDLRVKVLFHSFVECSANAASTLNITPNDSVLHREVLLCDGNSPLVFASSLLPEEALVGRFKELRQLGSRPLGHWIFSEPVLTRAEMHSIELPENSELFARFNALKSSNAAVISGRKTLFSGPNKPFLVSEFFLPNLQNRAKKFRPAL